MTTPPRSPDGNWLWDGQQWVPIERRLAVEAIASVVLALLFPFWPLSSIAAIILGSLALRRIGRTSGLRGQGLAIAGLVIGLVVVVLVIIIVAVIAWFGYECRNGC